jgi:predicted phage-related endonuclease
MSTVINRVVTTEVVTKVESVDLTTTEINTHINELNDVRRALKALEAQEKALKETIFELMGEAKEGLVNGVVRVAKQEIPRTDINRKELQTNFPDVWNIVSYANPYIKLVIK